MPSRSIIALNLRASDNDKWQVIDDDGLTPLLTFKVFSGKLAIGAGAATSDIGGYDYMIAQPDAGALAAAIDAVLASEVTPEQRADGATVKGFVTADPSLEVSITLGLTAADDAVKIKGTPKNAGLSGGDNIVLTRALAEVARDEYLWFASKLAGA